MSDENVMNNIAGIEMGQLVLDCSTPTNCIMIQTQRNKYCFRLSETFPIEKQYEIFRQFVIDVNTPLHTEPTEEIVNKTNSEVNDDEIEQKFNSERDKGE